MSTDLNELLAKARALGGPSTIASGVLDVEAHVAAWHAIAVQGGFSDPVTEAWRLSVDRGLTDRHLISDRAAMDSLPGPRQVDMAVVTQVVGVLGGPTPSDAVPETNDRGEFTGTDGKLWHQSPAGPGYPTHQGEWLACDGCNPPVVVAIPEDSVAGLPIAALRALYAEAKAAKDKATEEFETVKAKLQTALSEASGGAYRSTLLVPGFKPMTLIYTEPWRVDSKRLKAEQPAIYVQYAKQGSQWTLAESRAKS